MRAPDKSRIRRTNIYKYCALNIPLIILVCISSLSNFSLANSLYTAESPHSLKLTQQEKDWLAKHPKIIAGDEANWAPYAFIDSDGNYAGIANEYLRIIESRLGVNIEVVMEPFWTDILSLFHQQKIDLLPAIIYSRDRENFLFHTSPYFQTSEVIFTRNDTNNIRSLSDLFGKTVATTKGYVIGDKLKSLFPQINILSTLTDDSAINKVLSGEADAFIGDLDSTNFILEKHNITDIKFIQDSVLHSPTIHMGIRKDWPEFRDIIEKVFNSLDKKLHRNIKTCWIYQKPEQCPTP